MMKRLLFLFTLVFFTIISQAQDQEKSPILLEDSVFFKTEQNPELFEEVSELDPQRAALLSAIFPGMGQVYNKQYWKVPIVLAGIIAFGHFINHNNKIYHGLRNVALLTLRGQTNPYESIISSESSLIRNRDVFRRRRDYLIILGAAFYILQIVDAHVSAHLDEFKVNDRLTLGIEPSIQSTPLFSQAVGVSFVLKF